MNEELRYALLSKFPSLNPGWPVELQAKWFSIFDRLLAAKPPIATSPFDPSQAILEKRTAELVEEKARRLWAEAFLLDIATDTGKRNEIWDWDEEPNKNEWYRRSNG